MNLNELDNIIGDINNDFYEKSGIEDYTLLSISSSGYYGCNIICLGDSIWSTDNDDRRYIDEENEILEPMKDFLMRTIEEKIRNINKGVFGHSKYIAPKDILI